MPRPYLLPGCAVAGPAAFSCPHRLCPGYAFLTCSGHRVFGVSVEKCLSFRAFSVKAAGLNPRPLVPQTSALTGLRHAPTGTARIIASARLIGLTNLVACCNLVAPRRLSPLRRGPQKGDRVGLSYFNRQTSKEFHKQTSTKNKGHTKLSAKHVITPACICLPGRGDGGTDDECSIAWIPRGIRCRSAIALGAAAWCKSTKRHLARRTAI